MFERVLIANRGEIACRITGTLRRLGIEAVAIHTAADRDARHVRLADQAILLPDGGYLDIAAVVGAAVASGADAIHPGYGFLAENAAFASACAEAGVVFIGPSHDAIAIMGDKISAKQQVTERGVPTVPGLSRPGLTDDDLVAGALDVGFPVLIKPSAGGGGKGMHVVTEEAGLREAISAARREARSSFGDDALFLERYVSTPRHIEVQVLADRHGAVVHLGERECSLQRRHQKVVEEAPSPLLDAATREAIGLAACETARSVGYEGAGTVEFIVAADRPDEFFFMEMNTRLQVEHPVTEQVTGFDLVEQQLRIASGEALSFGQDDVQLTGHAIEVRLYAESPKHGFLPTGGTVLALEEPTGAGIRVDSALLVGLEVGSSFDPMLAKIIATGSDRTEALRRLQGALADTTLLGVEHNLEFLSLLLARPEVISGDLDTGLIERCFDELPFEEPDDRAFAEAALVHDATAVRGAGPWSRVDGWRLGAPAPRRYRLESGDRRAVVSVLGPPQDATVTVDDGPAATARVTLDEGGARIALNGRAHLVPFAVDGADLLLQHGTAVFRFGETEPDVRAADAAAGPPELVSPMPGTIVSAPAPSGTAVAAGDPVVVVEAMKMEHVLRAPVAGIVALHVALGEQVTAGQALAAIEPEEQAS